jgi:chromosome segregation ATPase
MSKSQDAPSSSSSAPAKRLKPMDRDERIAYLEGKIEETKTTLSRITNEILIVSNKRRTLLEKEELSSREENLLAAIKEDLARAEKTEARLRADIAEYKAELRQREQPVATSASTAIVFAGTVYNSTYLKIFIACFIHSKLF